MEYSNLFVCLMGLGIVFIGLLCLIALVSLMGRIFGRKNQAQEDALPAEHIAAAPLHKEKKEELLAAVTAAIAEDMHTDVSAVRIVSIKRV